MFYGFGSLLGAGVLPLNWSQTIGKAAPARYSVAEYLVSVAAYLGSIAENLASGADNLGSVVANLMSGRDHLVGMGENLAREPKNLNPPTEHLDGEPENLALTTENLDRETENLAFVTPPLRCCSVIWIFLSGRIKRRNLRGEASLLFRDQSKDANRCASRKAGKSRRQAVTRSGSIEAVRTRSCSPASAMITPCGSTTTLRPA